MAEWILVAIALFGAVVGPFISHKVSEAVNRRRWTEMDAICKKYDRWHGEHFDHAKNTEAHWTERERDGLDKKLDEIHAEILRARDFNHDIGNKIQQLLSGKRPE